MMCTSIVERCVVDAKAGVSSVRRVLYVTHGGDVFSNFVGLTASRLVRYTVLSHPDCAVGASSDGDQETVSEGDAGQQRFSRGDTGADDRDADALLVAEGGEGHGVR